MNFDSRKTMTIAIAVFLTLAIAVPLFALPTVLAQRPLLNRKPTAYIGATPNPVGVGQETLLHIGVMDELQAVNMGWEGLTVTVTKPNNATETLGPFRTDSTGGTGTVLVPAMVGTYRLQTHFPAQWGNWTLYGGADIWYESADSFILELAVQEEPTPIYPGVPLPAEYWTRPIDAQLREWSPISGNWLTTPTNYYAAYNDDAPETAHILWAKPLVQGGLAGGDVGNHAYHMGDAYEGFFSGSVIINGKLFYNKFHSIGGNNVENYVEAVDLHTGELLWSRPLTDPDGDTGMLDFGQVMYWDSFNVHGVFAYLWETSGSTWNAYDPADGRWLFTLTDVPSGSNLVGSNGEIIRYQVNLNRGYMTKWNTTAIIDAYWGTNSEVVQWGSWRPQGKTIDATRSCPVTPRTPLGISGYMWNVSIPTGLPGSVNQYLLDDAIIGSTIGGSRYIQQEVQRQDGPIVLWGISAAPGRAGQLLFNKTWQPPKDVTVALTGASSEDRVFVISAKETRAHYGFSIDTGELLWGPTPSQHYLDYLSVMFGGRSGVIAYGKLFSLSMSGILYAYDAKTGNLLWTYSADDPYNQVLWANDWHIRMLFIADGKIYMGTTEHSPVDPLTRGGPFAVVDVETGEEVWRADGLFRQNDWGGRAIIGDSIIATLDTYDMRIYGIGKGPTSTTAIIRNDVLALGSSVLIQGMVTDISPGTEDYGIQARFPNGVPAVADESMSEWMAYVYKQLPHPNIVGVPVYFHVVDENGNYRNIGEATTDPNGFYSLTWLPDIPGKYSVIVSFAGSKAYYPSYAYTAFQVDETIPLPPSAPTPEPLTLPPFDMYILFATIAIIATIVIIGLLILRKK